MRNVQLIGFTDKGNNFHFVRDLTREESVDHEKYTPTIVEAKNRFKLFRILHLNFEEWDSYIHKLRSPELRNYDHDFLQLDRLLLNYLTAVYTIQEHFNASFMRRFRRDSAKLDEYNNFIKDLCANCWDFAFFLDFRNHVQHCGLGIGRFNRQVFSDHSKVEITYNSKQLAKENRNWRRSKLTGKEGDLDLVGLIEKFHQRMLQDYGAYVAKTFFPALVPAIQFYGRLTGEVRKINPEFKMYFGTLLPGGKTGTASLSLKLVPNDILAELGISVSIRK